jgi:predicted PhzF superfamily epimerase YddE/YHI9
MRGNALAVVVDADALTTAQMAAFANRWRIASRSSVI